MHLLKYVNINEVDEAVDDEVEIDETLQKMIITFIYQQIENLHQLINS
jgi:hypothetical protein